MPKIASAVIGVLLLTASHAKSAKKKRRKSSGTLSRGTSLSLPDVGPDESHPLAIRLPAASSTSASLVVSTPDELMPHVSHAWDAVVAPNQAGLTEAKEARSVEAAPLTSGEAWHHYQAGLSGVVDSARLLIAFSVIPALQLATGQLHAAAARGDVGGLRTLLDSGRVLDVDEAAPACGSTALHFAASVGSAGAVRLLLDAGAFVSAVGRAGATPLMTAAAMGHQESALALLEGGADPNQKHDFGRSTALHFAAEMGRASLIRALCAGGADANARKTTGGTPLHSAADANQPEAVTALIDTPCNASTAALLNGDTSALYLAAQRGLVNTSVALIDGGAEIDFVMPRGGHSTQLRVPGAGEPMGAGGFYQERNTERGNGATALHAAVENGHEAVTILLLARGAAQLGSMEGVSPLLLSLQYKHPRIAIALARASPTPNLDARSPQDGASALFVAAGDGEDHVVSTLLALGAKVDLPNRHGATALSHAAMRGQTGAVSLLLAAKADPALGPSGSGNVLHALLRGTHKRGGKELARIVDRLVHAGASAVAADEGGITPLMLAADRGESAACVALLSAGADTAAVSPAPLQMTSLMRAASKGHTRVVRVLLAEGGAQPNARAGTRLMGASALYLAAQGRHVETMRALLEGGALVDIELDEMRATPLFVAAERGCVACVKLLLDAPHHANVHATNWNGVSCMHMAAIRGHVVVLKAIASHVATASAGSDADTEVAAMVNSRAADGSTALLAVAAGDATRDEGLPSKTRIATLKWLLGTGADRRAARATDGFTPLLAAVAAGHADAVATLLDSSYANPDDAPSSTLARTADGRSALIIAAHNGDVPTARALLRGGAAREPAALEVAIAKREHEMIALMDPTSTKSTT